ncbi:MAG: hypothetical protein ACAH59_02370 [Pseudobdellovibrionaceae bacterium]
MTNSKLIPILSVLFLSLAAKASVQFDFCDPVQVIDAEMNYLRGYTLKDFSLSESVYTKSILDPDEMRLADLPAQAIPKGDYLITETKTCQLTSSHGQRLQSFFVIQNQNGQSYQVPMEKMNAYLKAVVRKEVQKISFAYKEQSKRYQSLDEAQDNLRLQALSYCIQFGKMTQFKALPEAKWVRDESAKGLNNEFFNPAYYGMAWTRTLVTEFTCQ